MDNADTFVSGWLLGMLFCILMLGVMKGCHEHSAYAKKPCDNCGQRADQYTRTELKLCPICAGKLYELKNKKPEEAGK